MTTLMEVTVAEDQLLNLAAPPEESVGFFMTRRVITIQADEYLLDACKLMSRYGIGCLPVLEDTRVVGIFTDRLMVKCAATMFDLETPLRRIMEKAVSIKRGESIQAAIEKFRNENASHLLILNRKEDLEGLVSQTDVLEASRRLLLRERLKLAEAKSTAYRDSLTGLYSRLFFEKAFEAEFEKVRVYEYPLSLLLLDLDHFKNVNDRYGHSAGDLVLRHFGKLLREHVRKVDIPARIGGEEFAVLLPGWDLAKAAMVGDQIRRKLENSVFGQGDKSFAVTVSGGVSELRHQYGQSSLMFDEADRRLYQAKAKGRNRIEDLEGEG